MTKSPSYFWKICRQISAALTLIFFLSETLFAQTSGGVSQWIKNPEIKLPAGAQVSLPLELGKTEEIFGKDPKVIFIQDPHGHYQAQKNIHRLLKFLRKKTGFSTLLIEGAVGKQDMNLLRFFKEESFNKKAAHLLAREAEIGGPELFLLDPKSQDTTAYGIEEPETYLQNLNLFTHVLQQRPQTEKYLEQNLFRLTTQASLHLNAALQVELKTWIRHEQGEIDLPAYLQALQKAAAKHLQLEFTNAHQIDWPMLVRYFELHRRELKLDPQAAESERKKLIAWAKRQGITPPHPIPLPLEGGEGNVPRRWVRGKEDLRSLWESFYETAQPKGFRFEDYPALTLYEGYRILQSEIEAPKLFEEIQKLQEEIFDSLIQNHGKEFAILEKIKALFLLKKLFRLELAPEEYETIRRGLIQSGRLDQMPEEIIRATRDSIAFYEKAKARDQIMLEKILQKTDKKKPVVVIAGGFHCPGITQSLKEKNISYAVITPHMPEIESSGKYFEAMTGAKPKLDFQYFTLRAAAWTTHWRDLPHYLTTRREAIRSEIRNHTLRLGAHPIQAATKTSAAARRSRDGGRSEVRSHENENSPIFTLPDFPAEKMPGMTFLVRTNLDDTHFDLSLDKIDDIRIHQTARTIDLISGNGGKVILFNHIGRPGGKYDPSLRTDAVAEALLRVLGKPVKKTNGETLPDGTFRLIGEKEREAARQMQPGDILMLGNTRMDPREQSKDAAQRTELAKEIASLAPEGKGIFVMDGFPVTHRAETASVIEIAKLLPGIKGLWEMDEEKLHDQFSALLNSGQSRGRLTAIFGGAKEDKKIEIAQFSEAHLRSRDTLILAGKYGEHLLGAGDLEKLRQRGIRVAWPLDSNNGKDIGPETIEQIKEILLRDTDTLFWEGPLGKFEEAPFNHGTFEIAKAAAELTRSQQIKRAFISGGELGFSVKQALGWDEDSRTSIDNFTISTGGGTSIAYFAANGNLPGTQFLKGLSRAETRSGRKSVFPALHGDLDDRRSEVRASGYKSLTVTRKVGEAIRIGDDISVTLQAVSVSGASLQAKLKIAGTPEGYEVRLGKNTPTDQSPETFQEIKDLSKPVTLQRHTRIEIYVLGQKEFMIQLGRKRGSKGVRLRVTAPKDVPVHRQEVYEAIQREQALPPQDHNLPRSEARLPDGKAGAQRFDWRKPYQVEVRPDQSYRIELTENILDPANPILKNEIAGRKVFVIYDDSVSASDRKKLQTNLGIGAPQTYFVDSQEKLKDYARQDQLLDAIQKKADQSHLSRKDMFIMMGREWLQHVAASAAGRFHRGIPYLKIPTEPAQDHPAVLGARTGLTRFDSPLFDGFIYPPQAILIDTHYQTFSREQLSKFYKKRVSLKRRLDFSVEMSDGLLDSKSTVLAKRIGKRQSLYILDQSIGDNAIRRFKKKMNLSDLQVMVLEGGEAVKDPARGKKIVEKIHQRARRLKMTAEDVFVLVGGGAVLDVSGFAASRYDGGTAHIRIPTTLLAQIDAGIGVKNGINKFDQKNFEGIFQPAELILIDPQFLQSLDERTLRSGMSEMVKVALMKDAAYFEMLEKGWRDILDKKFNPDSRAFELMWGSVIRHLEQISTDPFETLLARPLDYGHEYGHRWERVTKEKFGKNPFGIITHGEGVWFGTAIDTVISWMRGYISAKDRDRILGLIDQIGWHNEAIGAIPTYDPRATEADLAPGLESFRIHLGGKLTISLLEAIGKKKDVHVFQKDDQGRFIALTHALEFLRNRYEKTRSGRKSTVVPRSEVRSNEIPEKFNGEDVSGDALDSGRRAPSQKTSQLPRSQPLQLTAWFYSSLAGVASAAGEITVANASTAKSIVKRIALVFKSVFQTRSPTSAAPKAIENAVINPEATSLLRAGVKNGVLGAFFIGVQVIRYLTNSQILFLNSSNLRFAPVSRSGRKSTVVPRSEARSEMRAPADQAKDSQLRSREYRTLTGREGLEPGTVQAMEKAVLKAQLEEGKIISALAQPPYPFPRPTWIQAFFEDVSYQGKKQDSILKRARRIVKLSQEGKYEGLGKILKFFQNLFNPILLFFYRKFKPEGAKPWRIHLTAAHGRSAHVIGLSGLWGAIKTTAANRYAAWLQDDPEIRKYGIEVKIIHGDDWRGDRIPLDQAPDEVRQRYEEIKKLHNAGDGQNFFKAYEQFSHWLHQNGFRVYTPQGEVGSALAEAFDFEGFSQFLLAAKGLINLKKFPEAGYRPIADSKTRKHHRIALGPDGKIHYLLGLGFPLWAQIEEKHGRAQFVFYENQKGQDQAHSVDRSQVDRQSEFSERGISLDEKIETRPDGSKIYTLRFGQGQPSEESSTMQLHLSKDRHELTMLNGEMTPVVLRVDSIPALVQIRHEFNPRKLYLVESLLIPLLRQLHPELHYPEVYDDLIDFSGNYWVRLVRVLRRAEEEEVGRGEVPTKAGQGKSRQSLDDIASMRWWRHVLYEDFSIYKHQAGARMVVTTHSPAEALFRLSAYGLLRDPGLAKTVAEQLGFDSKDLARTLHQNIENVIKSRVANSAVLEHEVTTPERVMALRVGDLILKVNKNPDANGVYSISHAQLGLLRKRIHRVAGEDFIPTTTVDFSDIGEKTLKEGTGEKKIRLGKVLVQVRGPSLKEFLERLDKEIQKAKAVGDNTAVREYENLADYLMQESVQQDLRLARLGLINTRPERNFAQKIIFPLYGFAKPLHASLSSLASGPRAWEKYDPKRYEYPLDLQSSAAYQVPARFRDAYRRILKQTLPRPLYFRFGIFERKGKTQPVSEIIDWEIARHQVAYLENERILPSKFHKLEETVLRTMLVHPEFASPRRKLLLWTYLVKEVIAYPNTPSGEALTEIFNDLVSLQRSIEGVQSVGVLWNHFYDEMRKDYPDLQDPLSRDSRLFDLFFEHGRALLNPHPPAEGPDSARSGRNPNGSGTPLGPDVLRSEVRSLNQDPRENEKDKVFVQFLKGLGLMPHENFARSLYHEGPSAVAARLIQELLKLYGQPFVPYFFDYVRFYFMQTASTSIEIPGTDEAILDWSRLEPKRALAHLFLRVIQDTQIQQIDQRFRGRRLFNKAAAGWLSSSSWITRFLQPAAASVSFAGIEIPDSFTFRTPEGRAARDQALLKLFQGKQLIVTHGNIFGGLEGREGERFWERERIKSPILSASDRALLEALKKESPSSWATRIFTGDDLFYPDTKPSAITAEIMGRLRERGIVPQAIAELQKTSQVKLPAMQGVETPEIGVKAWEQAFQKILLDWNRDFRWADSALLQRHGYETNNAGIDQFIGQLEDPQAGLLPRLLNQTDEAIALSFFKTREVTRDMDNPLTRYALQAAKAAFKKHFGFEVTDERARAGILARGMQLAGEPPQNWLKKLHDRDKLHGLLELSPSADFTGAGWPRIESLTEHHLFWLLKMEFERLIQYQSHLDRRRVGTAFKLLGNPESALYRRVFSSLEPLIREYEKSREPDKNKKETQRFTITSAASRWYEGPPKIVHHHGPAALLGRHSILHPLIQTGQKHARSEVRRTAGESGGKNPGTEVIVHNSEELKTALIRFMVGEQVSPESFVSAGPLHKIVIHASDDPRYSRTYNLEDFRKKMLSRDDKELAGKVYHVLRSRYRRRQHYPLSLHEEFMPGGGRQLVIMLRRSKVRGGREENIQVLKRHLDSKEKWKNWEAVYDELILLMQRSMQGVLPQGQIVEVVQYHAPEGLYPLPRIRKPTGNWIRVDTQKMEVILHWGQPQKTYPIRFPHSDRRLIAAEAAVEPGTWRPLTPFLESQMGGPLRPSEFTKPGVSSQELWMTETSADLVASHLKKGLLAVQSLERYSGIAVDEDRKIFRYSILLPHGGGFTESKSGWKKWEWIRRWAVRKYLKYRTGIILETHAHPPTVQPEYGGQIHGHSAQDLIPAAGMAGTPGLGAKWVEMARAPVSSMVFSVEGETLVGRGNVYSAKSDMQHFQIREPLRVIPRSEMRSSGRSGRKSVFPALHAEPVVPRSEVRTNAMENEPMHVIRPKDDKVLRRIMQWVNYIQANMSYRASKDKLKDFQGKPERLKVKTGGHPSAASSMKEILMAAWIAMHEHDYTAAKPHAQPADMAIQFLLGKLDPSVEISRQILGKFRNMTLPNLNQELFSAMDGLPPEVKKIVRDLIEPILVDQGEAPAAEVPGISAYPKPGGPGRQTIPMGSVGLGASTTVALAILHKYLLKHGYDVPRDTHFWALIGDGETDEGNALEMLNAAVEYEAPNVTHVIDYNRQSLDGNRDKFHYEELKHRYERWKIIELRWGRKIEAEFKKPGGILFKKALEKLTPAEYQTLLAIGANSHQNFAPELKTVLASKIRKPAEKSSLSDFMRPYSVKKLFELFTDLGGHDLVKLTEAMQEARASKNSPVAIIAWTIKGRGLPAMMGNPKNHSQILTAGQMEQLRIASGVPEGEDFPLFAPDSKEGQLLARISRQIKRQEKINAQQVQKNLDRARAKLPREFPKRFALEEGAGWIPTQVALNALIGKLFKIAETKAAKLNPEDLAWMPFADGLVVISPDVMLSTLSSAAGSIFGKPLPKGVLKLIQRAGQYGIPLELGARQSWTGRNLEPGLAEMKTVNLAIAFAKSPVFSGVKLFPVVTAYDMFIFRRALDIWFYGQYWEAPILAIGTPSGSGLAPEGGLHQSIESLIIALMMPNMIAYEPAFIDELEYIFPEIMKRMLTGDTENRAISYIRGSTVPVNRNTLWERLERQKVYQAAGKVLDRKVIRPLWGEQVIRGGYRLVDFRGYSAQDRLQYMKEVLNAEENLDLHILTPSDYDPQENVVHILASGPAVTQAWEASDELLKAGIYANVIVVTSPSLLVGQHGRNILDPDTLQYLDPQDEKTYPHLRRLIPLEERAFVPVVGVADGSSIHLALVASRLGLPTGLVDRGIENNGRSMRKVKEIWQAHGFASPNIVLDVMQMLQNRDLGRGTVGQIDTTTEWPQDLSPSLNRELQALQPSKLPARAEVRNAQAFQEWLEGRDSYRGARGELADFLYRALTGQEVGGEFAPIYDYYHAKLKTLFPAKTQAERDAFVGRVVEGFFNTPRHLFALPYPEDQDRVYQDIAMSSGQGQTISQPSLMAFMLTVLDLKETDRVLEIGAGSGWLAAWMSLFAGHVDAVERIPELAEQARWNIELSLRSHKVEIFERDGWTGIPERPPYDVIVLSADPHEKPEHLFEQLSPNGGRMIAPIDGTMKLFIKNGTQITEQDLLKVRFVDLVHVPKDVMEVSRQFGARLENESTREEAFKDLLVKMDEYGRAGSWEGVNVLSTAMGRWITPDYVRRFQQEIRRLLTNPKPLARMVTAANITSARKKMGKAAQAHMTELAVLVKADPMLGVREIAADGLAMMTDDFKDPIAEMLAVFFGEDYAQELRAYKAVQNVLEDENLDLSALRKDFSDKALIPPVLANYWTVFQRRAPDHQKELRAYERLGEFLRQLDAKEVMEEIMRQRLILPREFQIPIIKHLFTDVQNPAHADVFVPLLMERVRDQDQGIPGMISERIVKANRGFALVLLGHVFEKGMIPDAGLVQELFKIVEEDADFEVSARAAQALLKIQDSALLGGKKLLLQVHDIVIEKMWKSLFSPEMDSVSIKDAAAVLYRAAHLSPQSGFEDFRANLAEGGEKAIPAVFLLTRPEHPWMHELREEILRVFAASPYEDRAVILALLQIQEVQEGGAPWQVWSVPEHEIHLHDDAISALVFSADGKYLISADKSGKIFRIDAGTRQPEGDGLTLDDPVYALHVNPDGSLWIVTQGEEPVTGEGASVSKTRPMLHLLHVEHPFEESRSVIQKQAIPLMPGWDQDFLLGNSRISFSSDGQLMAYHSPDKTDVLVHLTKKVDPAVLLKADAFAFYPGQQLAEIGDKNDVFFAIHPVSDNPKEESGSISIHRFQGDMLKMPSIGPLRVPAAGVRALVFNPNNPDGQLLTIDKQGGMYLQTFLDPEPKTILGLTRARSAVFSPDGRYFATAEPNGSVVVWDAVEGKRLSDFSDHTLQAESLAFSPDGKYLISASAVNAVEHDLEIYMVHSDHLDKTIRVWNLGADKADGVQAAWEDDLQKGKTLHSDADFQKRVKAARKLHQAGVPTTPARSRGFDASSSQAGQWMPPQMQAALEQLPTLGARQTAMMAIYLYRIGLGPYQTLDDVWKLIGELQRLEFSAIEENDRHFQRGGEHRIALKAHSGIAQKSGGRFNQKSHTVKNLLELAMRVKGNVDETGVLRVRALFEDGGLEHQSLPFANPLSLLLFRKILSEIGEAEDFHPFGEHLVSFQTHGAEPFDFKTMWSHFNFNGPLEGDAAFQITLKWLDFNARLARREQDPKLLRPGYSKNYIAQEIRRARDSKLKTARKYRAEAVGMALVSKKPTPQIPNPYGPVGENPSHENLATSDFEQMALLLSEMVLLYQNRTQWKEADVRRWIELTADLPAIEPLPEEVRGHLQIKDGLIDDARVRTHEDKLIAFHDRRAGTLAAQPAGHSAASADTAALAMQRTALRMDLFQLILAHKKSAIAIKADGIFYLDADARWVRFGKAPLPPDLTKWLSERDLTLVVESPDLLSGGSFDAVNFDPLLNPEILARAIPEKINANNAASEKIVIQGDSDGFEGVVLNTLTDPDPSQSRPLSILLKPLPRSEARSAGGSTGSPSRVESRDSGLSPERFASRGEARVVVELAAGKNLTGFEGGQTSVKADQVILGRDRGQNFLDESHIPLNVADFRFKSSESRFKSSNFRFKSSNFRFKSSNFRLKATDFDFKVSHSSIKAVDFILDALHAVAKAGLAFSKNPKLALHILEDNFDFSFSGILGAVISLFRHWNSPWGKRNLTAALKPVKRFFDNFNIFMQNQHTVPSAPRSGRNPNGSGTPLGPDVLRSEVRNISIRETDSLRDDLGDHRSEARSRTRVRDTAKSFGTRRSEARSEKLPPWGTYSLRLSITAIYPGVILKPSTTGDYKESLFEARKRPIHLEQEEDLRALKMLEAAFDHLQRIAEKGGKQQQEIGQRLESLKGPTTIIGEEEFPGYLLQPRAVNPKTRAFRTSLRRQAIFISKKFLLALNPDSPLDAAILAFLLNRNQYHIDLYQKRDNLNRSVEAVHRYYRKQTARPDFKNWAVIYAGIDPKALERRLEEIETRDTVLYQNAFKGLKKIRRNLRTKIRELDAEISVENTDLSQKVLSQDEKIRKTLSVAHELEKMALYYHRRGNVAEANRWYDKAIEQYQKIMKFVDPIGYFPVQIQENIAQVFLRLGRLKEFVFEIEKLFSGAYVEPEYMADQQSTSMILLDTWVKENVPDILYRLETYKGLFRSRKDKALADWAIKKVNDLVANHTAPSGERDVINGKPPRSEVRAMATVIPNARIDELLIEIPLAQDVQVLAPKLQELQRLLAEQQNGLLGLLTSDVLLVVLYSDSEYSREKKLKFILRSAQAYIRIAEQIMAALDVFDGMARKQDAALRLAAFSRLNTLMNFSSRISGFMMSDFLKKAAALNLKHQQTILKILELKKKSEELLKKTETVFIGLSETALPDDKLAVEELLERVRKAQTWLTKYPDFPMPEAPDTTLIPLSEEPQSVGAIFDFERPAEARSEVRRISGGDDVFADGDPSKLVPAQRDREEIRELTTQEAWHHSFSGSNINAIPIRTEYRIQPAINKSKLNVFPPTKSPITSPPNTTVPALMRKDLSVDRRSLVNLNIGDSSGQMDYNKIIEYMQYNNIPLSFEGEWVLAAAMTEGILRVGSPLVDLLIAIKPKAEQIAVMDETQKRAMIQIYAAILKQGGKIVLPSEALVQLGDKNLEQYFDLILESVRQSGITLRSPVIYIAGSASATLKSKVFLNPKLAASAKQVFDFSPQKETVIANRLKLDSIAVSFAAAPEERLAENIPGFLIDSEEVAKLSPIDQLQYFNRMTQLQFLAAEQLKEPVGKAASQRQTVAGFLRQIGIDFEVTTEGFFQPSIPSLLSSKVAEALASQAAQVAA